MIVAFKPATQEDLPAIVATYNATVASRQVTADLDPVSVESRLSWFNSHNPQRRPLWLVTINHEYAGWMSFNSFYGRPAYDGTVEVSIYLEERHRGKGLGKACLQKAIAVAPAMGVQNLIGFIFGHNIPSLNLFYGFGFEKWAHLPGVASMDGVERDLVIVGKKIGLTQKIN